MTDEQRQLDGENEETRDERFRQPNYLKMWRDVNGLTQGEVESYFGWAHPKISNLERSKQKITTELLAKLAGLYECKPQDLLCPPPADRVHSGFKPQKDQKLELKPQTNGIITALEIISMLRTDIRAIKEKMYSDLIPRIERCEKQLDAAIVATQVAVKQTAELASVFEQGATTLRAAIKRSPATDTSAAPAISATAATPATPCDIFGSAI